MVTEVKRFILEKGGTRYLGYCKNVNSSRLRLRVLICQLKGQCHAVLQLYKNLESVFASIEFQN